MKKILVSIVFLSTTILVASSLNHDDAVLMFGKSNLSSSMAVTLSESELEQTYAKGWGSWLIAVGTVGGATVVAVPNTPTIIPQLITINWYSNRANSRHPFNRR